MPTECIVEQFVWERLTATLWKPRFMPGSLLRMRPGDRPKWSTSPIPTHPSTVSYRIDQLPNRKLRIARSRTDAIGTNHPCRLPLMLVRKLGPSCRADGRGVLTFRSGRKTARGRHAVCRQDVTRGWPHAGGHRVSKCESVGRIPRALCNWGQESSVSARYVCCHPLARTLQSGLQFGKEIKMQESFERRRRSSRFAWVVAGGLLASAVTAHAQVPDKVTESLGAPATIVTGFGQLDFKDGVPTVNTAAKTYDILDFAQALSAYNNSFRGASALAIVKGFEGIGAKPGDVVIFSKLMDSRSLFLTANADTVYYLTGLDLSKGPVVIEQPSNAVGTINDMWFSWIIDIGGPGPDRGLGGKYLIVGPGYDGPLPEGGYFIGRSKTNFALYAARAFLRDNDPAPAVENVKKTMKIYPYQPGSFGTSIAQALDGTVRIAGEPKIPETKFIEGSGLSFNTIPPTFNYPQLDCWRSRLPIGCR